MNRLPNKDDLPSTDEVTKATCDANGAQEACKVESADHADLRLVAAGHV